MVFTEMTEPMGWSWLLVQLLAEGGKAAAKADPTKAESILEILNGNPVIGWAIAVFSIVALATGAIAAWTGNLGKIIDFFNKYILRKPIEPKPEDLKRLRKQLLDILTSRVAKRRADSLHNLIQIDLEHEEQRQRVGRPNLQLVEEDPQPRRPLRDLIGRGFQLFNRSTEPETVSPTRKTLELFQREDINGRLLILGEPGSGKTTELLGLADDLLRAASEDEVLPIPVIFEISAWDGKPLEDWLVEQLYEVETVPKAVGKHWVANAQLLLLLDGLDELEHQQSCIIAIDEYLKSSPAMKSVICCRREEYESREQQFQQLNGAIYLQAVTDKKIQAYLAQLNRERLWNDITSTPDLLALARSPLFLSMLIVAHQGRAIKNSDELIENFIESQIQKTRAVRNEEGYIIYSREETLRYLKWTSHNLELERESFFSIENIKPTWIFSERGYNSYRSSMAMCSGLLIGMAFGALHLPIFGIGFGLRCILYFGIFFGPVFSKLNPIRPFDFESFSLRKGLQRGKNYGKRRAAFYGIVFGLIGAIGFGLKGLLIGFLGGTVAGFFVAFIVGTLLGGVSLLEIDLSATTRPNHVIKSAQKNAFMLGVLGCFLMGSIYGLVSLQEPDSAASLLLILSGSIFGSIVGASLGGLLFLIQHLFIRIVVGRDGFAPWNYARFLDHAANLRFIQRVGGRYRFMHDLLRKHFAAMDTQPPR